MRKPFDDRLTRISRPPVSLEHRLIKIGCFTETREDRIARIARIARLRRLAPKQPATADRLVSDAQAIQHVTPAPRPTP